MVDSALFAFLAAIHLLPAIAAVFPRQIQRLYGVEPADRTLVTLLQHRAMLLGLVGFGFLAAAFRVDEIGWHAWLLGAASMISFLLFAVINRQLTGPLRLIAIVDAIGLITLGILFVRQPWFHNTYLGV